jgi:hypothetical protein
MENYRLLQNINLMENVGAEKRYAVVAFFTTFRSKQFPSVPKHEVLYQ